MIGIVRSSLPDSAGRSAAETLVRAKVADLDGVLFNSVTELSQTLDAAELRSVRAEADRLGMHLSAMIGMINPALPVRAGETLALGDGNLETGLRRMIAAAGGIGISELMFSIGKIEDRFSLAVPWTTQMEAVTELIGRLAPLLREYRIRLLLKTHEEITSNEVVALVERVGSDLLGAAFDPVNSLCRLEEPVAAARRLAGCAAQVHADDAVLRFQEGGMRRFLAPIGEGVVDWDTILAILPSAHVWIELHSGQFCMPVFDGEWLRSQRGIALVEYAALLGKAAQYGSRDIPWDQTVPAGRLDHAYQRFLG